MLDSLFEVPFPDGKAGFDGGVDIHFAGKRIDVKTMGRKTDVRLYYVNNLMALQKDYETDIYIFCSLNLEKDVLTVCRWVTKEQLHQRTQFYRRGDKRFRSNGSFFYTKTNLYEIRNDQLNQINSFSDLYKQLKSS